MRRVTKDPRYSGPNISEVVRPDNTVLTGTQV